MSGEVVIRLSPDAALVLLVLVARLNEDAPENVDDQAEQRVLWDLEADLESAIPSIFLGDFNTQVQEARDRIRDLE